MILTAADIDEVRELVRQDSIAEIRALHVDGTTLPAALELACCWWTWRNRESEAALVIEDWAARIPWLQSACKALSQRGLQSVPFEFLYSAPEWEMCASPLPDQVIENDWPLFLARFARSLQNHGFGRSLSLSLSKALAEMSDNIIRHSGVDHTAPANGVIAYHIEDRRMAFAVADVGRGVLNSLSANPKWHGLRTSTEALQAAVWRAATSNPIEERGDGFLQVRCSLADLNGVLRFRSGDGVLSINGQGQSRQGSIGFVPPLLGFQLSVSCALEG